MANQTKQWLFAVIGGLIATIAMASCTTVMPQKAASDVTSRLAVVVVTDKNFFNVDATSYSWLPDRQQELGDDTSKTAQFQKMIQDSIHKAMTQKGYHFESSAEGGDLLLAYTIATGDTANNSTLSAEVGINPGLMSSKDQNHEKGTLFIEVFEKYTHKSNLRGAIEGFVKIKRDNAARQQRLDEAVLSVLEKLPNAAHVK